jgi:hypothetical protein
LPWFKPLLNKPEPIKVGCLFAPAGWRCLTELLLLIENADDGGGIGIFYVYPPLLPLPVLFTDVVPLGAYEDDWF